MVSCYLTRVILNVSVALTVTCYKPDGSVYNKTVCSLLPSNMAKLEILKDMFREKNMSIPDNLVTTPVLLLEPDTAEDDFYVDNENWKIKANKKSKGVRPTRIHPYSVMGKCLILLSVLLLLVLTKGEISVMAKCVLFVLLLSCVQWICLRFFS